MGTAPFRTFSGYLKQHSHETLSTLEQALFDLLFPAFQGTNDADDAYEEAQRNLRASGVREKIQLMRADRRPRRYSGFSLGRRRYFTICVDEDGNDMQTLAHELRAYRDPVDLGMVEVVDLAAGCVLSIHAATVSLAPQPAFAILIHEPQRLPDRFRALPFQEVPGLKDRPILIFRFPYHVMQCTIERTIDLRYPEVQDWFFSTFRHPCDVCDAQLAPEMGTDVTPTTALSRFHFENGRPPAPDSFWSMLPTLMNPDLGGGNPGDTGSTLTMIGHWMRQHRVGALVFPSARCNVAAVVHGGTVARWQGWNLLDYRDAPLLEQDRAHAVTFVVSPWAWVSLPPGVRLHMAQESSEFAGSFAIDGMVDYWARDYLDQLKALEVARSRHGREIPYDKQATHSKGLPYRVFQIGTLLFRWIRMLVQRATAEEVDDAVLELQGLAIPYGMLPVTGRILESWSGVKRGAATLKDALPTSLAVTDLLRRLLTKRYPQDEFDKLVSVAADLELVLFFLTCRAMAGDTVDHSTPNMSGFLSEVEMALATVCLDGDLQTRSREYLRRALHDVRCGGDRTGRTIEDGEQLQRTIYAHLRAKDDNRS